MSHSHHPSSGGSPESIDAGHELTDVKVAPLLQFGVMMAVVVAVTMWGVYKMQLGLESYFSARERVAHPMQSAGFAPAGPKLQVNEARDLAEYKAAQDGVTSGDAAYAWIDEKEGIVRIPIPLAMELVLEQGLPHRKQDK